MMTELQWLENRIGILEAALSELISYEKSILQPYHSDRWNNLNRILQNAEGSANQNDKEYKSSKDK
jgi:hypothetical protein